MPKVFKCPVIIKVKQLSSLNSSSLYKPAVIQVLVERGCAQSCSSTSYTFFRNNWNQDGQTGGNTLTTIMEHSNRGEVICLLNTFTRVWSAGGQASLSLNTLDGQVRAHLTLGLGPPSHPRPGAPEARGPPQSHPHHPTAQQDQAP